MKEYTVLSPINHDGVPFAVGETIYFDAETPAVAELIALRTIAVPEVAVQRLTETVRGSDYLPALIRITSDLVVPQSEIVERSRTASDLDVSAWNGLSDDEREERITIALRLYRDEKLGSQLGATTGIGTLMAAGEGARVAADNAGGNPEARVAGAIIEGAANPANGVALTEAERVDLIRGHLGGLRQGNPEDFTRDGQPRLDALERLAGFPVNRAMVVLAQEPVAPPASEAPPSA